MARSKTATDPVRQRQLAAPALKPAAIPCRECGQPVQALWVNVLAMAQGRWLSTDLCEPCTEAASARMQGARLFEVRRLRLKQAAMPAKLLGWDSERAEAEAGRIKQGQDLEVWQQAAAACWGWFNAWAHHGFSRGLYLIGKAGTGKTVLACCLLHRAVVELARPGYFLSATDLGLACGRKRTPPPEAKHLITQAKQAVLLVLDEVGAARTNKVTHDALMSIIDARERANRCTVYTSNRGFGEMQKRLRDEHDRIIDRIAGNTDQVPVAGQSFRMLAARGRR